jgi:hypothetical protein
VEPTGLRLVFEPSGNASGLSLTLDQVRPAGCDPGISPVATGIIIAELAWT